MFSLQTAIYCYLWISVGKPRPVFFEYCKPIADGVCSVDWSDPDLVHARKSFPSGTA
jgi:hypothetical protein